MVASHSQSPESFSDVIEMGLVDKEQCPLCKILNSSMFFVACAFRGDSCNSGVFIILFPSTHGNGGLFYFILMSQINVPAHLNF